MRCGTKKIYITVDTECHDIKRKNEYIDGLTRGGYAGLRKILDLAKENDIPINFFFDLVEWREYGEEYAKSIIKLIRSYGQSVYLHLHPDYVSGNHDMSFLWQYSHEEKKKILQAGVEDYQKFMGAEPSFIRIGRYGVDADYYSALEESGIQITDLSYCCMNGKMCHLSGEDICSLNVTRKFFNQVVFPNTRYIGFELGKRRKCFNVDASESTFNEFKRFIDRTNLNHVILTMHSWNFIKKWFFWPGYVALDKISERRFRKMVSYARKCGYEFCGLASNPPGVTNETDELIDLCAGVSGKAMMLLNNFIRFGRIARLNKKYFIIYGLFFALLISGAIALINILL